MGGSAGRLAPSPRRAGGRGQRERTDSRGIAREHRGRQGGPWGAEHGPGWWGNTPPYPYPVFILTHHPRDPVEMEGGTTFHFVTDGIESALEQARKAAGGKDVMLWGGANVAQQYLAAGLLDELELHVVPVLLGAGDRTSDNLGH